MRAMTTTRRRLIAAAIGTTTAVALALPGAAGAGGFATVGLSSLPDGTPPGTPWHVTLTILQHGLDRHAGAGAWTEVVERAGHFLPEERPDAVLAALRAHLRRPA